MFPCPTRLVERHLWQVTNSTLTPLAWGAGLNGTKGGDGEVEKSFVLDGSFDTNGLQTTLGAGND